jgi:DNA polymerase III subunit epsilon
MKIVALDFETATTQADSACAIGMAVIQDHKLVQQQSYLIRPPRRTFEFSYLHGITWNDVKASPTFPELIPEINQLIADADYIAAHNAGFDRKVLHTCYGAAGFQPPKNPFVCTVKIARRTWKMRENSLDVVCDRLHIPLNHHDHTSDALACARIVLASMDEAHPVENGKLGPPSYTVAVRKRRSP